MNPIDPHLEILLQDSVRLCPEDVPLKPDDWTGLQEISVFVHEQGIECAASTLRDYLLEHGCSAGKATAVSQHYPQRLHLLKMRSDGPQGASPQRVGAATERKEGT